jgi:hypothetical protein
MVIVFIDGKFNYFIKNIESRFMRVLNIYAYFYEKIKVYLIFPKSYFLILSIKMIVISD